MPSFDLALQDERNLTPMTQDWITYLYRKLHSVQFDVTGSRMVTNCGCSYYHFANGLVIFINDFQFFCVVFIKM